MWRELEERDRTVQSLQRQLAAIDRSPPPQAPPPSHPPQSSGLSSGLGAFSSAQYSSLHVGAPAFKPQGHVPTSFAGGFAPGSAPFAPPGAPGGGVVRHAPPTQPLSQPSTQGLPPSRPPTGPIGGPQTVSQVAARQRPPPGSPAGLWRCEHCTFENRNPPIYDQLTQAYKGFCEICQGVTTVKGR